MISKYRHRIYQLLDGGHRDDIISQGINIFLVVLILLNIIAVVLESVPVLNQSWELEFRWFELISVTVFTTEYLARLWSCVELDNFNHPIVGRIKYLFSPYALLDLAAILPFYVGAAFLDLRFLRMLRLFRLVRLLKLVRYLPSLQIFINAIRRRKGELAIALTLMIFLLIFSSSLMYFAERNSQPDIFSSIPSTMWWAVATLGKVSYGDVKPITTLGKILAGVISIVGIAVFALPAGILGSAFMEEIQERKRLKQQKEHNCPNCGTIIVDNNK